jgi:microcystin-dependent protein
MPMNTGVSVWSKTSASNASADSTINWAEGQAPSTVNDSARSLMSRVADWRDDISGGIATGGTSSAYTLTTNQGFTSLAEMNNALIAFVPHVTNAVSCTLAVNGITGCYVRWAKNTYMPEGVLVAGTPYVATFQSATNEFIVHNNVGANPYTVPLGVLMPYAGGTPPNSCFAFPFGQQVSRSNYSTLYALLGGTYGSGDGSTTFNLPDYRGRVVGFMDNMGGTSANRLQTGSLAGSRHTLGGTGGVDAVTLTTAQMPSHNHGGLTGAMSARVNPSHNHGLTASGSTQFLAVAAGGIGVGAPAGAINTGGTSIDHDHDIIPQGGGGAHDNVQPTMLVNCIMRII